MKSNEMATSRKGIPVSYGNAGVAFWNFTTANFQDSTVQAHLVVRWQTA